MKSVRIIPAVLEGEIRIPPSKSISHRAVICAGIAEGTSRIENIVFSDDVSATVEGMQALGAAVEKIETNPEDGTSTVMIKGNPRPRLENKVIDCGESGSTLRFLIPLAGLTGEEVTFTGRGKLVERPLNTYYELFEEQGIMYKNNGGFLPLTVKGLLRPGNYRVKGNISSQFISGLMFLLPLLGEDSRIEITTELESRGYVDLTMDVQEKFAVKVENRNNSYRDFRIKGNQKYLARDYKIEGDFSQAAFWLVAGTLAGSIKCLNLNTGSLQGDKAVLDIIREMGGKITEHEDHVTVRAARTEGTVIDAGQCPDLVPALAVLGALSKGTTRIINAQRLRIKESDRLRATAAELGKLGAEVQELEDGLVIKGKEELKGGTVDSWNDHRIAMAMAVASIKCKEPVTITNSGSVSKSYPHFWEDFRKLGGQIDERSMGSKH